MKNKTIILKEGQFKKLLENRMNEITAVEIADILSGPPASFAASINLSQICCGDLPDLMIPLITSWVTMLHKPSEPTRSEPTSGRLVEIISGSKGSPWPRARYSTLRCG